MLALMADRVDTDARVSAQVREFGRWMTAEQNRIFLLCRRMLQDADEADSATQDAFLKAYRAMLKGDGTLDAEGAGRWITRIAVNTCLDRLRSKAWRMWQRRPAAAEEKLLLERRRSGGADAERQVFAQQIQRRLEQALGKLSGRQRAVFSLRHYEAMTLEEIAGTLKLDVGTVKAHLFRALGKLREELKDLYGARA